MNERENGSRLSMDLDGEWEFRLDPTEEGTNERWYAPTRAWPEDASRVISLPHTWQEEDGCRDYTGTAWYRRTVNVGEDVADNGWRAFVLFGAADYRTEVWLNGSKLGGNRGGYLPFEVEATNALRSGPNTLVVAVTDPDDLSEIPHGKQGDPWYTRVSGIWQSVALEFRPQSHIVSVEVTPDVSSNGASVAVDVDAGPREYATLQAVVYAFRDGRSVATDSIDVSKEDAAFLAFDDPDYWTPNSPVLYDLTVQLESEGDVVDRYEDYFGLRSIDWNDGQILLNGEPIRIRGVLDQGYYPKTHYRPQGDTTAAFEHEIATAKELGFNLIRKHLKPAHPEFLRLADEMGILVWEEPANPSRFTERSRREVRTQLHNLITRDYNRPSVVIWSVYNEEWGIGHHDTEETLWTDETKQSVLRSVVASARERDPTRLICDNSGWAHVDTDLNDYHRYFVSPDRAGQWEDDLIHIRHHPGDNYATHDGDTDTPIMITELGTWAFCDLDILREQYAGDPPWFSHKFLTQQMKRPEDVDERFAESDLETVFEDIDHLIDCWQKRAMVSLKHLVEQMRKHEDIAGFVLTELSDTEWEFNGILDYFRNEKSFYDDFAAVNGDIAVIAEPSTHATWSGETIDVDVYVANDTTTSCTGRLTWGIADREQQLPVSVEQNSVDHFSVSFRLPTSNDDAVTIEAATVELVTESLSVSTTEPITVIPPESPTDPTARVYARGTLASRLAQNGIDVSHRLTNDIDVAFVVDFTPSVEEFLNEGNVVVQYPDSNAKMATTGPFSYRSLPSGESWDLTGSLLYQDSPLLADICSGKRIGWAFEGVYPHAVAVDLDRTVDTIHAGYIEGWVGEWGSPLVSRSIGDGTAVACTFQIIDDYGTHPAVTTLVDRLITIDHPDEP